MSRKSPPARVARETQIGSGLAGAGSGTLLVVLASTMPEGSPLRAWLTFAAPTVSICAAILVSWALVLTQNLLRDRQVAAIVRRVRRHVAQLEADPNSSATLKEVAHGILEEIDREVLGRELERVRSLAPVPPPGDITRGHR